VPAERNTVPGNAIGLSEFIGDLAEHVERPDELDTLELVTPRMHYASQDSDDAVTSCLDWRAQITLAVLDAHADAPDVHVGHVDFLVLQLGDEPAALVLDAFSQDAAKFTELFEGQWLAPDVESVAFEGAASLDVVLIVLDVDINEHLRGHQLGAWAVAEVVGTMLPTTAGLAVMFPHWDAEFDDDISVDKVHAVDRLNHYWQQVGLEPIGGHPGFLGQATAFTHLPNARRRLAAVKQCVIRVPLPPQ
jgi:hypothetical protein